MPQTFFHALPKNKATVFVCSLLASISELVLDFGLHIATFGVAGYSAV